MSMSEFSLVNIKKNWLTKKNIAYCYLDLIQIMMKKGFQKTYLYEYLDCFFYRTIIFNPFLKVN